MGFTAKPLHEEQGALLVRLDRRLEVQERSPTGVKTIGAKHLAVVPAARISIIGAVTTTSSGPIVKLGELPKSARYPASHIP